MFEVIIVGGGPAGLSAGLTLGRQRRRVLLFDEGKPRNGASTGINGFLSRDGIQPSDLHEIAMEELQKYDTVKINHARIEKARRESNFFVVSVDDGTESAGTMLLLSTWFGG